MLKERGIIIHPLECGDYFASQLEETHLNVLGVHHEGGTAAHASMENSIKMLETDEWRHFRRRMDKAGIAVEFEMHALSWILNRSFFDKHKEWFRMNEDGVRVPEFNCCASNPDVLDYIRERSAELARIFHPDTDKYYFWIDDVASASCQCEKCRALSPSDQALTLYNAIADGLSSVNSRAKQSYLAYYATLPVPTNVKKRDNVFLEFAPLARDFDVSLFYESRHGLLRNARKSEYHNRRLVRCPLNSTAKTVRLHPPRKTFLRHHRLNRRVRRQSYPRVPRRSR